MEQQASRLIDEGDISSALRNPPLSQASQAVLALQNIPLGTGQERSKPGLRLPRDRRHSLQRCSDLITPDTNSSETQLNLALGLILQEALVA